MSQDHIERTMCSLAEYVQGLENAQKTLHDEVKKLRSENQTLREWNQQLKTALNIQETNLALNNLAINEAQGDFKCQ